MFTTQEIDKVKIFSNSDELTPAQLKDELEKLESIKMTLVLEYWNIEKLENGLYKDLVNNDVVMHVEKSIDHLRNLIEWINKQYAYILKEEEEIKTCCVCGKPMPKPNTIGAHNKPFQENICSWKCWKEAYGEYEN